MALIISVLLALLLLTECHSSRAFHTAEYEVDSDIAAFKRNIVLPVLEKLSVKPSQSLCLELGMIKCGDKCCEYSRNPASHLLMRNYGWMHEE